MTSYTGDRLWSALDEWEREYLKNAVQAGVGLADACRTRNAQYYSVRDALRYRGIRSSVRPSATPIYNKHEIIHGDALIIPDPHAPFHDADLTNFAIELAVAWGIDTCVLAGDVFDFTALSPFSPDVPTVPLQDEIDAGEALVNAIAANFQRVLYIKGNHDVRLYRNLIKAKFCQDKLDRIFQFAENVTQSQYHFCVLHSGGKVWRITHPASARYNPGSVGNVLVAKHYCNVVVAHSHWLGYRRDTGGRYTIIDSGGCFHLKKLAYTSLKDNTKPEINQGFVIIRNGIGYLFDPLNLDREVWDAVSQHEAAKVDGEEPPGDVQEMGGEVWHDNSTWPGANTIPWT